MEGNQLFRDSIINSMEIHIFLNFLKKIYISIPKCYLFMDKRHLPPHYKSKKVLKYFEENKDTLIPVYLATAYHQSLWLWKRYGI